MKATEQFEKTIKAYLDKRATEDVLFAEKYKNEKKSIGECVGYILSTVKESGRCGFSDEEVYGMAVHYYDEAEIKFSSVGEDGYSVVVNQSIPLTEEEKKEARERALQRYEDPELERIKSERKAANAAKRLAKKATEPSADTPSGLLKQLDLFA